MSNKSPRPDKESTAFPILTDEQIKLIASESETLDFAAGDVLIEEGDGDFCFYVIQAGEIRITENSTGEEREVTVHGPGEFTGDIDMLTGHRSFFQAIASRDGRALKLGGEELREIIRAHSSLGDLLLNAFILRRDLLLASDFAGVRVIGSRHSQDTFRIRNFLSRNHVPFTWIDLEKEHNVDALLEQVGVAPEETPIILYGNSKPLRNPSNQELAEAAGFATQPDDELYDLVVVGGGPAGLAAAVYGASEGLKTLVVEESAPGGQASWSSKIENYLGFPTGLSGSELAEKAVIQADKFGVQMLTPFSAQSLEIEESIKVIGLSEDEIVKTRTVVIATGADYRRLPLDNLEQYEGSSVFYSATSIEASLCQENEVAIVGGGNSAGQAAIFLSDFASCVHIFIRGDSLDKSMSRYLTRRIEQSENIHLSPHTEVTALHGESSLERITVKSNETDETEEYDVVNLFVFVGAKPHTEWLDGVVEMDDKGFIKTGNDIDNFQRNGSTQRAPYHLETSLAGVFAAGDVRADSVKRVASAVGEGSMAVQFIHQVIEKE